MTLTEAQDRVVRAVAASANDDEWERIVVDLEIEEAGDDYRLDSVSFEVVRAADGTLTDPQFDLSRAARDAIIALYRQRKDNAGDTLGGFELQIDRPGKYKFDYSYEKPKRLNGIWDKASAERIDNYLDYYRREKGE